MDPTAAGNAAAASHTVGGRPVNTSGGRGRRKKKPLFVRDARLAQDGARLMTSPFRPPGKPPVFTPAAAVAPTPAPAPAATAMSTAAALDLTSSNNDYSQDSDVEVVT